MIYNNNEAYLVFLPEKRLDFFKYKELTNDKKNSILQRGMRLAHYKNLSWSDPETRMGNIMFLFTLVFILFEALAIEFVENPLLFMMLSLIFIVYLVVACIIEIAHTVKISKCRTYDAVCIGYLHGYGFNLLHIVGIGTRLIHSTPLFRLDTANGPLYVYSRLKKFTLDFPEINQTVPLYISDKGPEVCYDNKNLSGIIIFSVLLGISIILNFIVMLVKIF